MTSLLFLTQNLQKAVYLLCNISKEYHLEIAKKKTKVFGFVGTDRLRTKIIINDDSGVPRNLVRGGGVRKIQLRTERTGIWGR